MKPNKKLPFVSTVYLDSMTLSCPCGQSVKGEGSVITNFVKLHKAHSNGWVDETLTPECYRVLTSDTPNERKYRTSNLLK
jgi:hypothetical protein